MKKLSTGTVFIDVLFNTLLGIFMLLIITLTMINPNKKPTDPTPEIKGNILITLEWSDESQSDIDLLVRMPDNTVVFYGNRNVAGASLDRDDRGTTTDTVVMPDGTEKVIKENWEHVFITSIIPGWYTINTLVYAKHIAEKQITLKVRVEKFKPYQLIHQGILTVSKHREETTHVNLQLDETGKVINRNNTKKPIAKTLRQRP